MEKEEIVNGIKRIKNEKGKYQCLNCGKFNIEKKPSRKLSQNCSSCIKIMRIANLKKGRKEAGQMKKDPSLPPPTSETSYYVESPVLDMVQVISQQEKDFYNKRKKELMKTYDFGPAELDLLKTLLQISLEEKRLEDISLSRSDPKLIRSIITLSESKVKVLQSLAITRDQRLDRTETETAEEIIQAVINRYKEYRKKNLHRFVWKCKFCGKKNVESRLTPDYKDVILEEKKPKSQDITPLDEGDNSGG